MGRIAAEADDLIRDVRCIPSWLYGAKGLAVKGVVLG